MSKQITNQWNPKLELCHVKHEIRQEIAKIVASCFPGENIRGLSLPGKLCLTEQEVGLAMKETGGSIRFDGVDYNNIPSIPSQLLNDLLATNKNNNNHKKALHTHKTAAYAMKGHKGDFFQVMNDIYDDENQNSDAFSFIYFDGCGNALGKKEDTILRFISNINETVSWGGTTVHAVTFSLNCRGYSRERTIKDLVNINVEEMDEDQFTYSTGKWIPTFQAVADAIQQNILTETANEFSPVQIAYRRDYKNGSSPMTTMVFVVDGDNKGLDINKSSYDWQAYDWPTHFYKYSTGYTDGALKQIYQELVNSLANRTGKIGKELGIEIANILPINPRQAASMAAWFHPNLKKMRKAA